ncbi:hypothetical protein BDDG_02004 [Blastomyces dermatitidis ATCC 18188]|uniref:Uncharacterized protein n=1 Tax=Ajellomyces dermatitidis (strain ATCC 18188 / CBS 674.68) TaxID=653446 RepID=F2T753_AJEDA|nr:hypothetical protein BDDG_02004 [Blastomyces dermatitidis ATCC 18188]
MSPSISDSFVVQRSSTHALQLSKPSEQWKLSLQEVKLLYLRRQYKQCAATSTKFLRQMDNQLHAIHKAFLHYYSAISYEALGRGAHNYSSNKLPLLNLARDNFTACKSSLTVALPGPVEKKQHPPPQQQRRKLNNRSREHVLRNDKRKTYPVVSPTKTYRDAPTLVENGASYHHSPSTAPAQQSTSPRPSTMVPRQGPPGNREFMPLPLRIHKVCHNGYGYYQDQLIEYDPPSLPPPTRPLPELPPEANHTPLPSAAKTTTHDEPQTVSTVPLFRPLAPQFYRHSIGFSTASPPTCGPRRTGRNSTIIHQPQASANSIFPLPQDSPLIPLITSLCTQLDANINSICTLISRTLDLQRAHNAKKNNRLASFWSFTPTYDDENVIANDPFYNHDNHDKYDNGRYGAATTTTQSTNSASTSTATTGSSYNGNGKNTSPPPSSFSCSSSSSSSSSSSTSPPSSSSSSSSSSSTDETRQQRIARLKADGWTTVGLRSKKRGWKGSEYYERVCNEALAELYGNGSGCANGSGHVR